MINLTGKHARVTGGGTGIGRAVAQTLAGAGYLVWLEMFRWQSPCTRKVFRSTAEFVAASSVLAANQVLYKGFLAAGLSFGLWHGNTAILGFLLASMIVAGVYGVQTATKTAFFFQSVPAALAYWALL